MGVIEVLFWIFDDHYLVQAFGEQRDVNCVVGKEDERVERNIMFSNRAAVANVEDRKPRK